MDRAEAEAIYDEGREVVVAVLLRMDEQIRRLEERVARQDERIGELERKLNRSSRNSSAPPSTDPPSSPSRSKDPSGRKRGAQDGHEGHGRPLLPAWAVDEIIEHWPERCRCGHVFSSEERRAVGKPARHQVEEPADHGAGGRASLPAAALPGVWRAPSWQATAAGCQELLRASLAGGRGDGVGAQPCLAR